MLDRIEPTGVCGRCQCALKGRGQKGSGGDCSRTDPGGEKGPSRKRIPGHLCSIDKSISAMTTAVTCCCRCSESVQRQQCRAKYDQEPKRPLSEPRLPEPPFPPSSGAAETLTTDSSDADCVNPLRPAKDAVIRCHHLDLTGSTRDGQAECRNRADRDGRSQSGRRLGSVLRR